MENLIVDAGPIKLKIKPKKCEVCGGKFVPNGGNHRYCPTCKKLTPEEREEKRKMKKEEKDLAEVKVYKDEKLIKKKPAPVETDQIPEDELNELDRIAETAKVKTPKRDELLSEMISMLEKQFDVRLMLMDDVMPVQLNVMGKTYDGIWVEKRAW